MHVAGAEPARDERGPAPGFTSYGQSAARDGPGRFLAEDRGVRPGARGRRCSQLAKAAGLVLPTELRRYAQGSVISGDEIRSMIGLERQKQRSAAAAVGA